MWEGVLLNGCNLLNSSVKRGSEEAGGGVWLVPVGTVLWVPRISHALSLLMERVREDRSPRVLLRGATENSPPEDT